jgi:hypothetical protein
MENGMSDIANAIYRHLRTMAPHQLERLTAIQLKEAADEIERLRVNLRLADAGFTFGQPTLTDEERDVLDRLAHDASYRRMEWTERVLRGLLKRLK